MKPTFYRHIVAESWDLSRRHLFLWPLAFFASLVGIAGTFQIFFDLTGADQSSVLLSNWYTQIDFITSIFVGWSQSFDQIPWSKVQITDAPAILFFFLLLIIVIAVAIIVTSSEGGLIYALGQLQRKRTTTY